MKYDDASWHYGGDFPKDSPIEYGGTHIGLFLKWCFLRGWAGQIHLDEWPEDVARVVSGQLSGTEFLFKNCDEKLIDEDLNEQGNQFASFYCGADGEYLNDYAREFAGKLYVAPESAHDFEAFTAMVEKRYIAWSSNAGKPWWKIW